ncbi:MAG: SDR family oxidoreductase [Rhodospirillaceae bacterium]|nr:MAG: SDR family oxidoreductase [Rhodospirillaceae bacterium]
MDFRLKGKRAILAGATKGIGRATAEVLAEEGCDIAFCARGQEGIDGTLSSLKRYGGRVIGNKIDVTDAAVYRNWVSTSAEALGGCDIFVCFSSASGGPASEERWKAAFELDLLPTYRGIDAAIPYLEKSDGGAIVAVATTVAIEPIFGPQSYAPMKAAVINYAAALAQSLAPKRIRVNTISPGPIFEEEGDWGRIKAARPALYEATLAKIALGRLGKSEEVGRAIAFLVSPVAGFITGANLVIDGGITKRAQH